jgi:hypothetical protein
MLAAELLFSELVTRTCVVLSDVSVDEAANVVSLDFVSSCRRKINLIQHAKKLRNLNHLNFFTQ